MEAGSGKTDAERNKEQKDTVRMKAKQLAEDAKKEGIEMIGPQKAGALARVSEAIRRILALKKSQG